MVGIKINLGSYEAAIFCKGPGAERAGVCRGDGESDAEKGREGRDRGHHGIPTSPVLRLGCIPALGLCEISPYPCNQLPFSV